MLSLGLHYTEMTPLMIDPSLADFLIYLHSKATDLTSFKQQCKESGADFPESFLASVDRLILSMHPKYKKKLKKKGSTKPKDGADAANGDKEVDEDVLRKRRLFPGLAMPDSEWQPSFTPDLKKQKELDEADLGVDKLMSELEGVKKRVYDGGEEERGGDQKRRRDASPDYGRRGGDDDRGREGYGRSGGGSGRMPPKRMDDKPILYKVYRGKVAGIKDFGAFVTLEGIAGRVEGMSLPPLFSLPSQILIPSFQAWST